MSRWFLTILLLIGSIMLFSSAPLTTLAHADGDVSPMVAPTPSSDASPATPAPSDNTTIAPSTPATTTPAAPAAPDTTLGASPAAFPSKESIHDDLTDGRAADAEQAYLSWVSFWGQDDPALLAEIEHAMLLQDFRDGNFSALLAMVRAGDRGSIKVLSNIVQSGQNSLSPHDFATAIHLLGGLKDKELLNTLRLTLYSNDDEVVNASIEALGNQGDRRVVPDLMRLFEKADLARSLVLARALAKLGLKGDLQKRYLAQLRFPLPGASEKAALILAAIGNPDGWAVLNQIMSKKDPAYYPLALTVLSALPSEQSLAWVSQALAGTEQEQLAALQDLSLFPEQQQEEMLLQLLHDSKTPQRVSLFAVDQLSALKSVRALKELHALAMRYEPSDPKATTPARDPNQVKAEAQVTAMALFGLQAWGYQKDNDFRKYLRIRLDDKLWNEEVVFAARASLLKYALEAKKY